MNEVNVRYGVIDEKKRADYEKQWQVQMGYNFITYDFEKAVEICRKKNSRNWIVEKITNVPNSSVNYKTTIFRGGTNEENNRL